MASTPSYHNLLLEWEQRDCAIATMHGKETVIAPLLNEHLGITASPTKRFNTDTFGTFSGEITRPGNQLATARKKAHAAVEETGVDLVIVSEGSFATHPSLPLLPSNLELVLLYDAKHGIEVLGTYQSHRRIAEQETISNVEEALKTATQWNFPENGMIIRSKGWLGRDSLKKDIRTEKALVATIKKLLTNPLTRVVLLEKDLRAHRCLERRPLIVEATHNLIYNCEQRCPQCGCPGFVVSESIPGLPCAWCSSPTDAIRMYRYTCQKCHYEKTREFTSHEAADPGGCAYCNP